MDASTKAEGVDVWAFRWLIDCGIVQVQLGRKRGYLCCSQ